MTVTEVFVHESLRGSGDNPSAQQRWQPRIAIRLTPARPLPRLACGRTMKTDGGAVETLPHAEEADRVRTHYHFPGTALIH